MKKYKYYTHPEYCPYASFSAEDNRHFFFYKDNDNSVGYLFTDTSDHIPANSHFSQIINLLISEKKVLEVNVNFLFYSKKATQYGTYFWSTHEAQLKQVTTVSYDKEGTSYLWEDKQYLGIGKQFSHAGLPVLVPIPDGRRSMLMPGFSPAAAVKIQNAGYPAIAVLSNDPRRDLKSWLFSLPQKIIAILDNDENMSGNKLRKFSHHSFKTPDPYKDLGDMKQEDVNNFIGECLKSIK